MVSFATLKDLIAHLIDPWLFMSHSARRIPRTILDLLTSGRISVLLSPWAFRDVLFGHFWATIGPNVRLMAGQRVIPLLEGRIKDGTIQEEVFFPPVSGNVLEVGAGTGLWADVFLKIGGGEEQEMQCGVRRRGLKPDSGIKKIYGVEPNPASSKALSKRVQEVGLGDVYEVIPVGIESLSDPTAWSGTTIEPESIDSVMSILCLCSIPDQEKNLRALYELLKPGGRWYVYEHVKVQRGGILLSLYQQYVDLFWSFFLGGCRLCRHTEANLVNAGPWASVDLAQPPDEPPYKLLPHRIGYLTK